MPTPNKLSAVLGQPGKGYAMSFTEAAALTRTRLAPSIDVVIENGKAYVLASSFIRMVGTSDATLRRRLREGNKEFYGVPIHKRQGHQLVYLFPLEESLAALKQRCAE